MSALLTTPARGTQLDALRQAIGGARAAGAPGTAPRTNRGGTDGGGPTVLVCASGRGGSGTSLVSVALALAASGDGHRTLLVDGDELLGSHALMLGVSNADATPSWTTLRSGQLHASELVVSVSPTLDRIAGGASASAGTSDDATTPLSAAERRACLARLHSLAARYALLVIDAGSRLEGVLAALDNAAHDTRLVIVAAGSDPIALASAYALLKAVALTRPALSVELLANQLDDSTAARVADALARGAEQFLSRPLAFAGAIPHDLALDSALRAGMPFFDAVTGSPVAVAAHDTVLRMLPVATTSRSGD